MAALSMDYIGGLMDADGSFSISISEYRYKNKSGDPKPQFSFVVNFRQLEKAREILESIQETLGVGKIYTHAHSSIEPMLTWQTTSAADTRAACLKLLPFLKIKSKDCNFLLGATDLWLDSPRTANGGRPGVSDEVKAQIVGLADQMNSGQQKETSRRNKELRRKLKEE